MPFSLSSSSEHSELKMFWRRSLSLWNLPSVALPQHEDKHIKENPSHRLGKTTGNLLWSQVRQHQGVKRKTRVAMKPGKSAGNLKLGFVWKGSSGKTVVEVRCCGARRGCMWLMHRYTGHFGLEFRRQAFGETCFYSFSFWSWQ